MNYEEKYKEALEKARARYDKEPTDGYVGYANQILKELFPELAESEDERIRRTLVEYHSQQFEKNRDQEIGLFHKDALAYLEKQKEKSMSATEVLARAGLKPYKDGNQWCILAGDNIQEGICGFGDTIDEALYQFLMEVLEKQKENPKSADSIPSDCMSDAKCEDKDPKYGVFPEDVIVVARVCEKLEAHGYPELAHALKNINLYTKEQKPEWSEEDEDNLNRVIRVLEDNDSDWKELSTWLKSLRPSWKPSEEQMEAFKGYIKDFQEKAEAAVGGWNNFDVMILLYEQLKKLM